MLAATSTNNLDLMQYIGSNSNIKRYQHSTRLSTQDYRRRLHIHQLLPKSLWQKPANQLLTRTTAASVRQEVRHVHHNCSEMTDKLGNTRQLFRDLTLNGYESSLAKQQRLKSIRVNKPRKKHHTPKTDMYFLKLPYFDHWTTVAVQHAVRRQGLGIQIVHTGYSLKKALYKNNTSHYSKKCTLSNCPISEYVLCLRNYLV